MDVESRWSHTAYSPVLLLMAAVATSLCLGIIIARAHLLQRPRGRWLLLLVGFSPLPLLLLSYAHLPVLSSLSNGSGFCFGEIGAAHFVSFLLPPVVGLLTLVGLRVGTAGGHR